MRRRNFLLICALGYLPWNSTIASEPAGIDWHDDVMAAWQMAQAEQRPLLLYVSMPGCKFCRKMEAETLRHPTIAQQVDQSFVAAHFNGQSNPQFARRLGVTSYPTTVIISPENRILTSINGFVSPQQFQVRLHAVASAQVAQQPQSSSRRQR